MRPLDYDKVQLVELGSVLVESDLTRLQTEIKLAANWLIHGSTSWNGWFRWIFKILLQTSTNKKK